MSMLYVWHPVVLDDGHTLQVMITRGDSDQVGNGSPAFLAAILKAFGVTGIAKSGAVEFFRSNFYSEYWEEPGWESKWDVVWRCRITLAGKPTIKKKAAYVGIDEIDEYAEVIETRKKGPFACLAVAEFSTEKAATSVPDAAGTVFKVAPKRIHLHVEVGTADAKTLENPASKPNTLVAACEAAGGRVHVQ